MPLLHLFFLIYFAEDLPEMTDIGWFMNAPLCIFNAAWNLNNNSTSSLFVPGAFFFPPLSLISYFSADRQLARRIVVRQVKTKKCLYDSVVFSLCLRLQSLLLPVTFSLSAKYFAGGHTGSECWTHAVKDVPTLQIYSPWSLKSPATPLTLASICWKPESLLGRLQFILSPI